MFKPEDLMVVCANCHLKVIHHRNFKNKNNIIDIKPLLFDDKRKQELIEQNREIDMKKNNYILDKLFHFKKSNN